ncbi:hypothetical protein OJAV_G00194040 [Oryzias javanicus]|uniref:Uncharacterized protein n=1 Tax=Oryzias javanicus TaxID=123683 RepID=A0A3S2MIN6_ORYJA|nr:hypothetical protein OJAV_G00194040 [Oryzias javanicus]
MWCFITRAALSSPAEKSSFTWPLAKPPQRPAVGLGGTQFLFKVFFQAVFHEGAIPCSIRLIWRKFLVLYGLAAFTVRVVSKQLSVHVRMLKKGGTSCGSSRISTLTSSAITSACEETPLKSHCAAFGKTMPSCVESDLVWCVTAVGFFHRKLQGTVAEIPSDSATSSRGCPQVGQ